MGREVKRVALGFEWPLKKRWTGYLMPEELEPTQCEVCDGTGLSAFGKMLKDKWYGYAPFRPQERGSVPLTPDHPRVRAFAERNQRNSPEFYGSGEGAIAREATRLCSLWNAQWVHHLSQADVDALIAANRLYDLTARWEGPSKGWIPTGHHPTAQEVNDWSISSMGHDSINQWIVTKAECVRHGVASQCSICDGEGSVFSDDAGKAAHDAWEPTEPPQGEGWQMWENTSEGSPISPVMLSPEALAQWLADNGASACGYDTATYEAWLATIRAGYAFTMIVSGDVVENGVCANLRL